MLEVVYTIAGNQTCFCNLCAHDWMVPAVCRFSSVEGLIARTGVRRDEIVRLAEIGALNSLGFDRREALWQVERAIRPAGDLFRDRAPSTVLRSPCEDVAERKTENGERRTGHEEPRTKDQGPRTKDQHDPCPLTPMTAEERTVADYAGTGLTIGPHPMALRRHELAMRGVLRAIDLPKRPHGRRIRVAGTVITRQRPGTAKGFVFLTLEDETGIANIIVHPTLFTRYRRPIVEEPFLLVEGVLQNQEGMTSVRAEHVEGFPGLDLDIDSHDFH